MSFCTAATVSFSCFAIAWPRNDSMLKLLVLAGKIRNATIVTSLLIDCKNRIHAIHVSAFSICYEFCQNIKWYTCLWKKYYWIQYSWYWNVNIFTHFGSFCETSRRFDLSSRSLGHVSSSHEKNHVTKASRWEVETSWSFKKRSKVSENIHIYTCLISDFGQIWQKNCFRCISRIKYPNF